MSELKLYGKYFKITFWLIIILETLSFLAYNFKPAGNIIFILISLVALVISIWRLKYGFWIACTELFIGSFGYLFYLNLGNYKISIRLVIFTAVFIAWLIQVIKNKNFAFKKSNLWRPWLIFSSTLALGMLIALRNSHPLKNIFFDSNAYLYYGLIFVAFQVISHKNQINKFLQILGASIAAMSIKTLFLLFYFSHQTNAELIKLVYRWVRDTRIGEISPLYHNFYRIFFQSHIWAMFLFIIIFIILSLSRKGELARQQIIYLYIMLIFSGLTIVISFSRSLWLALVATLILIFLYFKIKEKVNWKKIFSLLALLVGLLAIDFAIVAGIISIKIPSFGTGGRVPLASLVKERVSDTEEAAVASRFELLKPLIKQLTISPWLGSGFGTEVSFHSQDPRTKNVNGGIYTTYSFEWGYLDILVKIGLVGLGSYLFFIWKVLKNGIAALKKSVFRQEYLLILSLIFSLISLLIVHTTTPYLNHPLGIFLIIISASIFNGLKNHIYTSS